MREREVQIPGKELNSYWIPYAFYAFAEERNNVPEDKHADRRRRNM